MTTYHRQPTVRLVAILVGAAGALASAPAAAQPAAPEQNSEHANAEAPTEDSTDLKFQAGAQLQSGNTQSYAINGGMLCDVVRNRHAFHLDGIGAWGASAPPDGGNVQRTARNVNTSARYDYYLTGMDALFVGIRTRWDTFAGLYSRLQNQIGYLRNFVKNDHHRFWGEVGWDLTWDEYFTVDAMTMTRTNGSAIVNAARAFVGLESQFNEHVKLKSGAEALFNVEDGQDVRVNALVGLTTAFSDKFKLEILFTVLFDNVPVPGNQTTDTTTLISLIYDAI